jgi:hypothetical protein
MRSADAKQFTNNSKNNSGVENTAWKIFRREIGSGSLSQITFLDSALWRERAAGILFQP